MTTDTLLDEIQDLNLSYLLLVQRLLNDDRASAMFRLKLTDDMADLLVTLTVKQLSQLSRTNQLLCRPCYDDADKLRKVTHNPRSQDLSQTHAALLMAAPTLSNIAQRGE